MGGTASKIVKPLAEKGLDLSPQTSVQTSGANSTLTSTTLHNSVYADIHITSTSLLLILTFLGFLLIAGVYWIISRHNSRIQSLQRLTQVAVNQDQDQIPSVTVQK